MPKIKTVVPTVYLDFHCVGSACKDHCCRPSTWDITVDGDSYKRYSEMTDDYGKYIVENIDFNKEKNVGKIMPTKDGLCPFMDEKGLCNIQKNFGGKALCETCKAYPRVFKTFNGQFEVSLSLSCPEVAKKMIFPKEEIELEEMDFDLGVISEPGPYEAEAVKIRAMLLGIMIYNGFSLLDKLTYMGLFLRRLSRVNKDGNYSDDVEAVNAMFLDNLYEPDILSDIYRVIKNVSPEYRRDTVHKMFYEIFNVVKRKEAPVNLDFYDRIYKLFDNKDEIAEKVCAVMDGPLDIYERSNPHVFRNYLFYRIYFTQFPKDEENFEDGYKVFLGEFLFLKVFIAALYHDKKVIYDTDILNAIYYYNRTVSHNASLKEVFKQEFENVTFAQLISLFLV